MGERGYVWGQRQDFMVDVLNHNAVECPVDVTLQAGLASGMSVWTIFA